jgi:5-methylcytosine-specific restriction endonuclease McrA
MCGKPGTEVHHRVPLMLFRSNPERMEQMAFDESNLMTCCRECHEKLHTILGKNKNKREHAEELHKERLKNFYKNYFE